MSAPFSTRTSGDLIADRRYAYADAALAEGDFDAARDLFVQTLEIVPHWPPAHVALARACLGAGDREAARAALEAALALDPADHLGASVLLASLASAAPVMPDAYVAALFDDYAPRFDSHLVEALAYRAPALLAQMLARNGMESAGSILDLGCGTGLMARALPPGGQWHGVDLSAAMIEQARRAGGYVELACAELLAWLGARAEAAADLVLAADVFCYVPDLEPVFAQVARVLRPGGAFAFSIQTHEGAGVVMGADQRVHHAPAFLRALARAKGFGIVEQTADSTRLDRGHPVPGALFLLVNRA